LRDLIVFHQDSFKADESYSPRDLDAAVKADELLSSDPRAIAVVRGVLHVGARDGKSPKTLTQLLDDAKQNFKDNRADVRPHLAALGGDWETKGAIQLADDMQVEFEAEFIRQGAHPGEAVFRAKRRVAQVLNDMATDHKKSYIVLTSKQDNASIKLFMGSKSGTMVPVAAPDEVAQIRVGITAARANKFNKDPINVNVMANDSTSAMPTAVSSQLDDGDLAFTYFGGDGVFIYPQRVSKMLADGVDSNWFSTNIKDSKDLYKHLIVHETGHLQMYKLWGQGKGSGRAELEKDFTNFNVSKDGTSDYGSESISESFAEQYAKYLLTGNASQEFIDLLSSKGLTKAQLNKKWRENHKSLFSSGYDIFFKFLDGVMVDDQQGVTPEYNGPEAREYSDGGKYGAGIVHRLGRILGFTSNKPDKVDSIKNDKYVIYRGLQSANNRTPIDMHAQFMYADMPYYGYGIHGDGQYSSTNRRTARGYAGYTDDGVVKMRVKPTAKVYSEGGRGSDNLFDPAVSNDGIDIRDVYAKLFDSDGILAQIVLNEIDPDLSGYELQAQIDLLARKLGIINGNYMGSKSHLAALLGFQGIEINQGGESFVVILDRSMLEMQDPNAQITQGLNS
jgi:hypothetical protein